MLQFTLPTRIAMGQTAVDQIGEDAKHYGKKALIITDTGVHQNGMLEPVLASLQAAGVPSFIYDGVVSNPTISNVEGAFALLKQNGCDVIIAVGGGSPIDTAKAVSVVATSGGHVRDYEGVEKFTKQPLPVIAIPTTVGTGSEVTKGSVITDPERHVKMVIVSTMIYPVIAYLDPRMVAKLPGPVAAATGMDALTHALEGYIATGSNPITDALNLHAIELVGEHLLPAVAGNRDSLYQMLIAACIAGAGFHNSGLGLVHALANTMGGHFPVHHGVANALLLPYVMEFNLLANPKKFSDIAVALGEKVEGLSQREAAARAIAAVKQLMKDVNLPTKLNEVGIREDAIPQMAQEALTQIDRPGNPRANSVKDLEALYRAAF